MPRRVSQDASLKELGAVGGVESRPFEMARFVVRFRGCREVEPLARRVERCAQLTPAMPSADFKARHDCVAAAMRRLDRHPRRVFDYLRMTENSRRPGKHAPPSVRTN